MSTRAPKDSELEPAGPAGRTTPDDLARACSEAMHARDCFIQSLGISLAASRPGHAEMVVRVGENMVNGYGTCHGGLIFTLADATFSHACNNRNVVAVASSCHIDYVSPARLGDILTATATERSLSGRTGIYDIVVKDQNETTIALFRGRSHRLREQLIPDNNG